MVLAAFMNEKNGLCESCLAYTTSKSKIKILHSRISDLVSK